MSRHSLFIPTLTSVVETHYDEGKEVLLEALTAREDVICDALRLFGQQYGLHPEVVAEVISNQIHLGSEITLAEHQHIREQYNTLVERLRDEQS